MINKEQLIEKTVRAIMNSNGQMLYSEKNHVRNGEMPWTEEQLAIFCLADEVITHNIPLWPKGIRTLRDISSCWSSAEVFRLTSIDEHRFKTISHNEGFNKYRKFGTIDIGRLDFRDDTHEIFMSGSGSLLCDFIDLDHGYKIEAKYNYFSETGSPSKLHDAEYLLNYGDYDAELYTVVNGKVPFTAPPIAIYEGIAIPRRHIIDVKGINAELMQLIKSGELIPEIEKRLTEEGFQWNP